jgi:hypothetical protein
MDRVGFEPTTSDQLGCYIIQRGSAWEENLTATQIPPAPPFSFCMVCSRDHQGVLKKGIVDYEILIVKH